MVINTLFYYNTTPPFSCFKFHRHFAFSQDLGPALDYCFTPSNFATNTGGYFPLIKANPGDYLVPTSAIFKSWLQSLRANGVRLFLLTNSHSDYTNLLLTFCYGRDWPSAFDLVLFNGTKDTFFKTTTRAFVKVAVEGVTVAPVPEGGEPAALALNGMFSNGNYSTLQSFLLLHSRSAAHSNTAIDKTSISSTDRFGVPWSSVKFQTPVVVAATALPKSTKPATTIIPASTSHITQSCSSSCSSSCTSNPPSNPPSYPQPCMLESDIRVMYCGDQPWTDVTAVKRFTSWQAVAIFEELLLKDSSSQLDR